MKWDAVVIGSGIGGLAAAVALGRAGHRVLVLEQHYLPGGWCHSFSLEGFRFSPGVHYVGELGRGGGFRAVLEGLGLGRDLAFREMNPDGFDHFVVDGERFDVPAGLERYIARLTDRFPHERDGIRRYFGTLVALREELVRCSEGLGFPHVLALPLRAPTLVRWGLRTLDALLDATVRDPLLRAFLVANSGNHGLPPDQISLPVHAAMVCHYLDGAFYPVGGAKRIVQAFLRALRAKKGAIRVSTRVDRIVVDGGRTIGVQLDDGEFIECRNVISNADPMHTYGTLLDSPRAARLARKARRMEYSVSAVSLFCATDLDLRGAGIDSGNYWWFASRDVDAIYRRVARALPQGDAESIFLAVSSLKDPQPSERRHVIEMFMFAPYAPFASWAEGEPNRRGWEYDAIKNDLRDKMLAAADRVVPKLSEHLVFDSVATPVTNDFYCRTVRGAIYGTAKTPWQVGPFSFGLRGPVEGLYCCGASTFSHGVAGAIMSGLGAAKELLHARSMGDLLDAPDGSLTVIPADAPAYAPADGATVVREETASAPAR